jgi:hypothetical protein
MKMSNTVSAKVVTGVVRLSYAYVWEPRKQGDDTKEKYSVQLIIPKSDTETVTAIKRAIEKVFKNNPGVFGSAGLAALKQPLRDGDAEKPADPNYKDSYFMNASSLTAPGIVDRDVKPILDRKEVYSGCYARVSLNFFPYDKKSKGIGAGLQNIQKVRDGDPLGGHTPASEDFDTFGAEEKSLDDYGFLD